MEPISFEIKMRLSQDVDAMMSMMHRQINRPISSATSERVIQEIQNNMSLMSSGNRDTEYKLSVINQDNREETNEFKTKITSTDYRSAFDLRDTEDRNSYTDR